MADVITRFKLETTQYDSKLRDAAKGLQAYGKQIDTAGKDFTNFSQKAIEAARSLGTIASGANNTKDKLKDLVGAYNDVANTYNKLTEQQRQTDFGKNMAASLEQLQVRIRETKQELYSLSDSGSGSGGGGITGMLQVFGGNLMTKAAEYMAKLGSEVVEITKASGELAKQAEGVIVAFERLGRPGLLDNLKEATHGTVSEFELMKAAVQFNDFKLPLEELGTMLAFAQQKAKDTGQSVDYMVQSIVTGLGRKSVMILDNLGLSAAEVRDRMNETGDMTKAVGEIIREQMSKAGEYVDTASDKASRANAKLQDEMLALGNAMKETFGISSIDDFSTAIKTELVGAITFTIETINEAKLAWQGFMEMVGVSSPKPKPQGYFKQGATMPNGTYVESTDSNGNFRSGYWNNGEIAWNSAGIEVVGTKREKTKTPRTGGKTTKEFDISKIAFNAPKVEPAEMIAPPSVWEQYAEGIRGTFDTIEDELPNITSWTKNFDPFKNYMDEMNKKLDQQKMAFQMAGQAANSFGAALAGIEDPATKAAGTVIQAIANVALGFGSAVAQASSMGPYAWIAYVAAAMGAMATAISTVHSLTGYAQGGIVQGNSYSGDNMMFGGDGLYGLNSGELVLTKAQQGNLASQLSGGAQNLKLDGVISGENIHIVHNRYLKRTGQGELVTWG